MPLVVPVLRFFVVFLNVYETFKTLKPPPPSARRGGQPSVRAMTQRKRDLKGCLAVWVVWCCYAAYERTLDRVVGIFLPFYSEIKSVFLLFLLLTRAKGAEPLFLHILRPLVKPYTVVVDPMLEISRDIGDFLFALLQVPLEYIQPLPWLPSWCTGMSEEEPNNSSSGGCINSGDSESSTRMDKHSSILGDHDAAVRASCIPISRHGSVRSISDTLPNTRPSANYPADSRAFRDRYSSTSSLPAYSEHPSHDPPQYSSRIDGHQIWYPPASAYPMSGHGAPIPMHDLPGTASEYHSPEWRTYPAFPSAYPPTPLPASSSLPNSVNPRISTGHRRVPDSSYPLIPEDEQGFGATLEKVHKESPGLVHSSSNNKKLSGVDLHEEYSDVTRQPDEDALIDDSMCSSEAGLSEDDFGSSLRTPHRQYEAMPSGPHSSDDDLPSALTTTSNATSLRTKTSSDSGTSETSSLAGRKRTHGTSNGAFPLRRTLSASDSRHATLRGKVALPYPPQPLSTSDYDDESGVGDDNGDAEAKRQRVLDPVKRISTVRPVARGLGNVRKDVASSRSATVRNRTVPIVSQAPTRTRSGSTTASNSVIRERKPTAAPRPAVRGGPQGVVKSTSASSFRSGTLKGRG